MTPFGQTGPYAELAGADGSDWRLDRSQPGEPSFFDLLAGAASDGTEPTVQANLPSVCTGTATLLTYYGEPSQLCSTLRNGLEE